MQDSLPRCTAVRLFMEKSIVFQTELHTFAIGFMHFRRDVAKDRRD